MAASRSKRRPAAVKETPAARSFSVVLSGVGGQGLLLASRVLCEAAMREGQRVSSFESHGMAQRGGAVITEVRWGREPHAPRILEGEADMIVALEPIEALRRLALLGEHTVVVINTKPIPPITVSSVRGAEYPGLSAVLDAIQPHVARIVTLDGTTQAEKLGNPAVLSALMLGAAYATGRLPLEREQLVAALAATVPERFVELNLEAFETGERLAS